MDVDDFAALLPDSRRSGEWYSARCPSHDDSSPSLRFKAGDTGVVVRCMGPCSTEDVLEALGMSMSELFYGQRLPLPPSAVVRPMPGKVVEHAYRTTDGKVAYTVYRGRDGATGKKKMWGRLPAATERILYNLPEVAAAKTLGATIYVVEGEKDADSLAARGFVATTNPGGAGKGKWLDQYTQQLRDAKRVYVIADNDAAGRPHALDVAAKLRAVGIPVTCYLPAAGCKDVTEMFDHGLDLGALEWWDESAATAEAEATGGGLDLLCAADIEPKPVPWAWVNYLPRGTLVYLEGDPAASKSTVSIDLAARFTRGDVMPDGSASGYGAPVDVIMLSAEDDPEYTIAPRAIAAGADMKRLHIVRAATPGEPFDLSLHLGRLRASIIATNAKVLTIDPLATYLGEKVETGSDPSVRKALQPLFELARELDVLVIVVRHLNKNTGGKAMGRSSGSVAFIAIARASFVITRHPEDETLRVLAPLKTNLVAESDVPALAYALDKTMLPGGICVARVSWRGAADVTAQEALDGTDEDGVTKGEYRQVLLAAVEDEPLSFREIFAIAKAADLGNEKRVRKHVNALLRKGCPPGEGRRGTLYAAPGAKFPWEEARVDTHVEAPGQPFHPHSHFPPKAETVLDSDVRDDVRERTLLQQPKVCDICGQPGTRFFRPWWVIRCGTHKPMTWRP